MAETNSAPPVSPELVGWLERLFPLRPASPDQRHRDIWMDAGVQRVLTKLRHVSLSQTTPQEDED